MTLLKGVHDPISLGNDPIFSGSWRLQVVETSLSGSLTLGR